MAPSRYSQKNPSSSPLIPHLRPSGLWRMSRMANDESHPRGLRETARLVGVPARWLRDHVENGTIPCLRADGVLLFSVEAVQRALLALATPPQRTAALRTRDARRAGSATRRTHPRSR